MIPALCFHVLRWEWSLWHGGPASVVISRWGMCKPSSLIAGQQRSQQAVFGLTAVCSDGVTGSNHHDSRSVFRFCLLKVAKHSTRRMRTGVPDRGHECPAGPRHAPRREGDGWVFLFGQLKGNGDRAAFSVHVGIRGLLFIVRIFVWLPAAFYYAATWYNRRVGAFKGRLW